MNAVFLSASVPAPDRDPSYFATGDVVAIQQAVIALTTTVLRRGRLVFGGHPLVSPAVWSEADRLGYPERVRVYQSRFFAHVIPPETAHFEDFVWVDAVAGDREASLLAMRRAMLQEQNLVAGVFIGGMEGVEAEYAMFVERHPELPAWPVASTGAASRRIAEKLGRGRARTETEDALRFDMDYLGLFGRLVAPLLSQALPR